MSVGAEGKTVNVLDADKEILNKRFTVKMLIGSGESEKRENLLSFEAGTMEEADAYRDKLRIEMLSDLLVFETVEI